MKNKIFRVFIDVRAKDREDAVKGAVALSDSLRNSFRVQEDPLTDEEEAAVLKMTLDSLVLHSVGPFQYSRYFAEDIGLSNRELKQLQKKIDGVINR